MEATPQLKALQPAWSLPKKHLKDSQTMSNKILWSDETNRTFQQNNNPKHTAKTSGHGTSGL